MNSYKNRRKEIVKEAVMDIRENRFWEKQDRKMKKLAQKKDAFSMEFPHADITSRHITKDDELRIEAMASRNGLNVCDETLLADKSVYFFKKEK